MSLKTQENKKGFKNIVFELMKEKGKALDQDVFNLSFKYGLDIKKINLFTVQTYVALYKKQQYLRDKQRGDEGR